MPRPAVFLDRDGVLTVPEFRDGRSFAPVSLDAFRIYPDAAAAVARLHAAGFLVIVATNQPDVTTGKLAQDTLDEMHRRLAEATGIDGIEVSTATRTAPDRRRKPQPGMLFDAARKWDIDLAASYMVGDRASDIECGRRAGCRTVHIDLGYTAEPGPDAPDATADGIAGAVDWICADCRRHGGKAMNAMNVDDLKIKLFADGADLAGMLEMYADPKITGFTTNPTLMKKAGIADYEGFAKDLLAKIPDRPVSLEVFADDLAEMERQARRIASWGANVNVKIPVTTTTGESCAPIIERLAAEGVVLNITAIMTLEQVRTVGAALAADTPAIVSVFAGRIADTGLDPVPHMAEALTILSDRPKAELLWASPRELLNVFQADAIGCHIITATNDILKKLALVGKDLDLYSRETVQMFRTDAVAAGYTIA